MRSCGIVRVYSKRVHGPVCYQLLARERVAENGSDVGNHAGGRVTGFRQLVDELRRRFFGHNGRARQRSASSTS